MEFIVDVFTKYQLNMMFALSLICGMLAFFVLINKTLIPTRKYILLSLELCAMFMLIFDRMAYLYRGNTTTLGFWMVRISNFMAFALIIGIILSFTLYFINLLIYDVGIKNTPRRLKISCVLCFVAFLLLIISQFTNFYYYFDKFNRYHRASGFMICYLFPLIILLYFIPFNQSRKWI